MKRLLGILAIVSLLAVPLFSLDLPEPAVSNFGGELKLDLPEPVFSFTNSYDYLLGDLWAANPEAAVSPMTFKPLAVLAQAASTDAASTVASESKAEDDVVLQGLLDNVHYRESLRLNKLSVNAFDYGDYDAAKAYAHEAAAAAKRSDDFVALRLKIRASDEAYEAAKARFDWAGSIGAEKHFASDYAAARSALQKAVTAREQSQWDDSIAYANLVLTALLEVKEVVEKPVLPLAPEVALPAEAKAAVEKARSNGLAIEANTRFTAEWAEAEAFYMAAMADYGVDNEKSGQAFESALPKYQTLTDKARAAAQSSLAEAKAKAEAARTKADSLGVKNYFTTDWSTAEAAYSDAQTKASSAEAGELAAYKEATTAFTALAATFDELSARTRAVLQKVLTEAQAKALASRASAVDISAKTYFPTEWNQAEELYSTAGKKAATVSTGDLKQYEDSISGFNRAADAYDKLVSMVKALLAKPALPPPPILYPLPAQFVVRSWLQTRDCLWNIAGLPWIYNDPEQWPVLYEANKAKLPQPNNPDLVPIGLILEIPSLYGESRQGVWSSTTLYAPLIMK